MILHSKMFLSSVITESKEENFFTKIVNSVSSLSDTLQNMIWIISVIFAIILIIFALFSIRKRTNKYTETQIEKLKQNGKYIPGIFIELNQTKEILRYFIFAKKWRKRVVKEYNSVYDNFYGDILQEACQNTAACFKLKSHAQLNNIQETIKNAIQLHNGYRDGKEKLKDDFKESQYLFEIIYYPYCEILEKLQKYIDAACSRYFILTGSAGNGKTNLLCSISELLINLKEAVIFLNSRDMNKDALTFLFKELNLPDVCLKYQDLYLRLVNFLLFIKRKHLFIVIDAINENDNKEFITHVTEFINYLLKFNRVKIVVSCRNEYYQERFRNPLVEAANIAAFEYDLKEQNYSTFATERIFKAYSNYFHYNGKISPAVQSVLSKQLLLLRIFFEVNENSDNNVLSICKHDIFQKYIKKVQDSSGENVEELLDILSNHMLQQKEYDGESLSDLKSAGIDADMIRKIMDSGILISKKLVTHEDTIARTEKEIAYFVFDEMRDYYLARRIALNNISGNNSVDGDAILTMLEDLKISEASCVEGIIHYTYVFFRTDSVIMDNGNSEELCKRILNIYQIKEEREQRYYWDRNHRKEFINLGMRIILTSGLPIMEFEVQYICECLYKDPQEDASAFFEVMLQGTLYNGTPDIDTYFNIIFSLKNKDKICTVLGEIIAGDMEEGFNAEHFLIYHKRLTNEGSNKSEQIQKLAELFLLCFKLRDSDMQNELYDYFYNLLTHDKVKKEMLERMTEVCALEVTNYK